MARDAPFGRVIATVANRLRHKGFRRIGKRLWSESPESWAIIEFQSSTKSSASETLFTVNLGTASKAVLRFLGQTGSVPRLDECHWRQRIGFVTPARSDVWWKLSTDANASVTTGEVLDAILQFGLPALDTHRSDAALKAIWMSGNGPGVTNTDRLRYLSILLKMEGSGGRLDDVSNELQRAGQGKPNADLIELHLKKLGLG